MLRPAALMERARTETGLDDFGPDSFREGLEQLLGSVGREARLHAEGEVALAEKLVLLLANRLQVEAWYRRHPEIDEQQIPPLLLGLGLPRTGSTALAFLLAEDPSVRSLRAWEAERPCPPPELGSGPSDARIALTRARIEGMHAAAPDLRKMLPMTATGPNEDHDLMSLDFTSQAFVAFAHAPSYAEWLYERADLEPTYRYYARVLKLLQWHCPARRWSIKSPSHMLWIQALDRVFPDARFVMTHRAVARVLPSICSMYALLLGMSSHAVDRGALGRAQIDAWKLAMQRALAFRDAGQETRFFDIDFHDLQTDPLGSVSRLYAWLGEELSETARARMQTWWSANPRDRHGSHRYRLHDYELDPQVLRREFAFYERRFGSSDSRPQAPAGSPPIA